MPFFIASKPVRRGVLWALRSRAAVEVLFKAGLDGWWAKRSGFGAKVDLMVRIEVYASEHVGVVCCWRRHRADLEGMRN